MAKSANQKLKLLYLMQFLMDNSDENHPISIEQMIAHLKKNDISAERKSLYDDIDALRRFGIDICMTKCKPSGYYIVNRAFEVPELKLLVDSVQSSQFITEKKTLQLIKKLESLCSVYEAQLMRRQVYVSGRIKHMNESIYYAIDAIFSGINDDRQINFKYFEYTPSKTKRYRHDGKIYKISPFAMMWDNENYYMIGFDSEASIIKHYRVDRMEGISLTDIPRTGHASFSQHDMSVYSKRNFSMYGGEETRVTLQFDNRLVGVMLDRFGKEIPIIKVDELHSKITAIVAISPQFYGWLFALGDLVKIIAPQSAIDGMKAQLLTANTVYFQKEDL